jgi:tetratricopeptide (TPR) repeat protein
VAWGVKSKADAAGARAVSKQCLDAVGQVYARNIALKRPGVSGSLTIEQFEESLRRNCENEVDRARVRARVYAGLGNEYYWQADLALAKEYYKKALMKDPWMLSIYMKRLLLLAGKRGDDLRKTIFSLRG